MPRPLALVVAAATLATAAHAQAAGSVLPPWVVADSAARTVALALDASPGPADGSTALAGYHQGGIQLVIPLGWTVTWTWVNRDSLQNHSLVLMTEREKLPTEGGRPALDNALSRAVVAGLKPGQRDVTTFIADQAGWYWLLCGVPGHALGGEWIGLKVDRGAVRVAVVVKEPGLRE